MKQSINALGIFGGASIFREKVHVGRPNIGDRRRFQERMDDILDRKWLSNAGKYVTEFEKQVVELLGVKHCIAMCNGTIALEIASRALGLKGEVIVPSFTFVATVNSLYWQEITPVFCDIDPRTHNIDPAKVERLITPRTTGIVGVHVWGRPCNIEALAAVARQHNLRLMFDAAHAFGCSHCGRMIGGFGDAEVFSFHATKFMNTLEGGAVTTNDDEVAKRVRWMKNFGFVDYDKTGYIGINGKMNEISAAMGLTNLENMETVIDANRLNHECYRKAFGGLPGIKMAEYDDSEKNNYQYVVVEMDEKVAGISRDHLVRVLHAENVLARRYFHPGCHRLEPYKTYFPNAGMLLPETERLCAKVVCFPTGSSITADMIGEICGVVRYVISNATEINRRLSAGK